MKNLKSENNISKDLSTDTLKLTPKRTFKIYLKLYLCVRESN